MYTSRTAMKVPTLLLLQDQCIEVGATGRNIHKTWTVNGDQSSFNLL